MKFGRQTTLRQSVTLSGRGVHSNAPVQLILHPADANSGISFLRTGLADGGERLIEAKWSQVSMTRLCTVLGHDRSFSVSTVEHLLAALAGLSVDNCLVEIDGPEMPIMDGSSAAFVDAVDQAGLVTLSAPRRFIKILKKVRVEDGRAYSELHPGAHPLRLDVEIDFSAKIIGRQKKIIDLDPATFRRDVSRARTFGFLRDVEQMWKAGFALGSSLENSVGIDDERILNPEGLRYPDEFVRHKALDAVGDLALAGAPLMGTFKSYCGGHDMNVRVLAALFADRSAYELAGAPQRRDAGQADFQFAAMPAFAPDTN